MPNSCIHLLIATALQKNVIPQLKMGNLHSYLFIDHYNIEISFFRWELGFFSL